MLHEGGPNGPLRNTLMTKINRCQDPYSKHRHNFLDPRMLIIRQYAATCDFQQCGILTSVDLDEPVQPALSLDT